MNIANDNLTGGTPGGAIEREERNHVDTGFLVGLFALAAYLPLWWSQLPSINDVTSGTAEPNGWTTLWPLLGLFGPMAVAVIAGLFGPGLDTKFSARLRPIRWALLIGLLIAATALGVTAPVIYRAASDVRAARVEKQDQEKSLKLTADVIAAATRNAAAEKDAKLQTEKIEIVKSLNDQMAATKADLESKFKQQLKDINDAHGKNTEAAKKKVEAAEKKHKEELANLEELNKKLADAAKTKTETTEKSETDKSGLTGDPNAGIPKNEKDDDPFKQMMIMAMAGIAGLFSPALAAALAAMLGITLDTDTKTVQDVGKAFLDSFKDGKIDPDKLKDSLTALAKKHPTPKAGELAKKVLDEYKNRVSDSAEKGKTDDALAVATKAFDPGALLGVLTEKADELWGTFVGATPTIELLEKLVKQVQGVTHANPADVVAAIKQLAKRKSVPEALIGKIVAKDAESSKTATASAPAATPPAQGDATKPAG